MKRLILTCAVSSLFSVGAVAQTPTSPSRPAGAGTASANGAGVSGKIAFISTSDFLQGINELKVRIDALNTEFEPKRKEIQVLEEELKNLKNKIDTQGGTVSPQIRNQWTESAAEKEKLYKRQAEDYDQTGRKRLAEATQPIYEKIRKFMESYCQQREIVLVFEATTAFDTGVVVWASPAADITDNFMKEYNQLNPAGGSVKKP
jgi:Skp family chaperone for outer membrane proteins